MTTPLAPVRIDVDVQRDGSIFVFTPNTPEASAWLQANTTTEPWQWLGASLCIDGRFAVDLANAMITEGYVLQ